jgi:hypothetical protein
MTAGAGVELAYVLCGDEKREDKTGRVQTMEIGKREEIFPKKRKARG